MKKSFRFFRVICCASLALSLILCSCSSPLIGGQKDDAQNEGAPGAGNADSSSSSSTGSSNNQSVITYKDNGFIDLNCESRRILFNSQIKEDSTYFYYVLDAKLWRTSKNDPDDTVCLFPKDDSCSVDGMKFAVYGGSVFVFAEKYADYTESAFRIDSEGNASEITLENELTYYSSLDIYNDTLYFYSFDSDKGLVTEGYKLNSGGSIGDSYNEFADISFDFGDDLFPLHISFGSYKCSPSSIDFFGGMYCMDSVGNKSSLYFVSSDDSTASKIADISDGNIAAITKDKLIMLQNDSHGKCIYTIDLSSGERTDLLSTDGFNELGYGHSSDIELIDYDDENAFIKVDLPLTEDPMANISFDILKVSLSDGSTQLIGTITKGEKPGLYYSDLYYNFTSRGLTYTNVVDANTSLCNMSYDEMGKEVVLTTPEYNYDSSISALSEYGITLKSLHSAYYYTDDNYDIMVFRADLIVPQLPATSDAFIEFNETIAENLDVTDMAQLSLKDAKSIAEDSDPYDEYSPMDLYPYTYSYYFSELSYHDSRYVCLTTSDYEYWGGAHGLGWEYSYTLDMQDGRVLELSDVIGQTQEEFVELVCSHVTDLDEGELFCSYDETAQQIRDDYTYNDFNWFLTPEGVAVRFRSYEIAPYVAGYPVIVVPYSELTMLIQLGG